MKIRVFTHSGCLYEEFVGEPTYLVVSYDSVEPSDAAIRAYLDTCALSIDGDLLRVAEGQCATFEHECQRLGVVVERMEDQHWHYYAGETCHEVCIGLP